MNQALARAICVSGLIAGPLLLGAMAAGRPQVSDSPEDRRPPERLDDPWLPRDPALGSAPATPVLQGQFLSIQVNIDAGGLNIIGDAANEPSIGVDPTAPNRIVIGWRQFDTIASNFRQGGWGYSHDGGRTWTFPGVLEPGIFRSDPVVDADDEGRFYYLSLHTNLAEVWECRMFISQDGGLSWGEGNFAFGGDKAWFAFDRSGGIGHGNLYQAWNTGGNVYFPNQFNRSLDGGLNWSQPIEMPMQPVFGTVAVGPAGRVFVAGWRSGEIRIVRSSNAQDPDVTPTFDLAHSVDLGGSFAGVQGPNPAGLLGQVWVALDRSGGPMDGNVYMLSSVNPPGTDPLDVMFARSEDGAKTWSDPVRVNDDAPSPNAWQWFGTMSVAPTGRIDVIFNDTRKSQQTNISELFYTSSTDGGRTWSKNIAVSPPFDSWVGWPNQNKIGDYYDMISDAVGAHVAWAATFNGEQDVYYLRIGDYDCNGNGIGDTEDLANGDSNDCNENGITDECEIAAGTVLDNNGNGIPDECEGDTVIPDEFSAFRGFYVSGDLDSLLESDDDKLCYNPGIVLFPTEAPIMLDFFGTLPTDSPASLDVTIESSANSVGLELTFSFWNFNTASWDVVGVEEQTFAGDTVRTFAGTPADHVEPGTGEVRTRYEVRVVSFIFLFPWTDCVDHVFWSTTG